MLLIIVNSAGRSVEITVASVVERLRGRKFFAISSLAEQVQSGCKPWFQSAQRLDDLAGMFQSKTAL